MNTRNIIIAITIFTAALAIAAGLYAYVRNYQFINKPTGLHLSIPGPARSVNTDHYRNHTTGHGYYMRRDERREGK